MSPVNMKLTFAFSYGKQCICFKNNLVYNVTVLYNSHWPTAKTATITNDNIIIKTYETFPASNTELV